MTRSDDEGILCTLAVPVFNFSVILCRVERGSVVDVDEDTRPRRTTFMATHEPVKVTQSVIDTFDPLAKPSGKSDGF